MGTMSVRSTYALDAETAQLIRRLSAAWGVSQAEVIRRSVRIAVASAGPSVPSPAEVVEHYRTHPAPRSREETERVMEALRALRHEDDLLRTASQG